MTLRPRYPTIFALATVLAVACTTDTLIGPKDVAILVIAPDTVSIPVHDTILLQGVATDSRGVKYVGERITWTSSNPSVATISADGHLITLAVGGTTVTASAGGKSATAQVTVTPPPTLTLAVDSLGFAAVARGPAPATQVVVVTNTGGGALTGITPGAVTYVGPDTGWLSVTPSGATAPDTITLAITVDTFPVGTYTATLPISAPKTTNGAQTLKVTLTLGAGVPSQVIKSAGDTQTATVKTGVAVAPAVIVKDAFGNLIPGVTVTFATAASNGTLTGAVATTNAAGLATLGSWTLDSVTKADTLTATVGALPAVVFTATGKAGAASQILKSSGDGQTASAGTAVAAAPTVTVKDQYGNDVAGVTVTFATTASNGAVTGATPSTNAAGVAAVGTWTLGTAAKTDSLTATAAGVGAPVLFTASATAGAATTIAKSAGGTTGVVNTVVAPAPAVIVTDQFGNPVQGVAVAFAATASNGAVTGGAPTTNAAGVATIGSWTLATTARTDTLTATSGSLAGSPVTFLVVASAGAATTMTKDSGDGQTALAGAAVAVAPAVLVKDAFNNPVSGVAVTFAVVSGGGSVLPGAPVPTNAAGVASVASWHLGNAAGPNSLSASAPGLTTVTFNATATAGAATTLTRLGLSAQADTIGAALAVPDSVKVTDQFGNPVAGTAVTWVAGSGGTLTPGGATTNAAGIATATRSLGTVPGLATDTAKAAGLAGSPALFTTTTSVGHGATLVKGAGDAQTDTAGATLAIAYTDTVKDRAGNVVQGVTVTWGVTGGGSITPTSITGANGVAAATRVLGTVAGPQGATGTVAGLVGSPVNFTATATHGVAKSLAAVAGTNGQAATVGTPVTTPPSVKVTDQFGNPVSGVAVTYALGAGGARNGSVTGTTPTTNGAGVAPLTSWTLGAVAGPDTVVATSAGLTGSPLLFIDFGNSGAATTMSLAGGNNQTDTVLATLPHLDSVLVTDGVNPVSGVTVNWAVTKGAGTIPPSSLTNANGIAVAQWVLGDTAETQNATATVSGLIGSPVTFSAIATHGAAKTIALNGGNGQSATVHTAVATAPSVKVTDQFGNPVSGVGVTFAIGSGAGGVTGATPTTDVSGVATVGSWTLGNGAGANTLTATAGGLTGSPVTFTATGTAGAAFAMSATAGTGQSATVNSPVTTPPAVTVVDQFGNGVSGVAVTFAPATVASGAVTGGSPTTDLTGTAAVTSWTLGSLAKTDTLVATSGALTPVNFFATATPGAPTTIAKSGGDAQTDTVNAKLAALTTLVTDGGGNPVPGVTVNWLVTSGSATLALASSITDGAGVAADTVTLGTVAGGVSVQASSGALPPVSFSATANPGNPTTLAKNGGDGQNATVNTSVATAPSVKVTDQFNNAVNGVVVTFAIGSGGGSVGGANPTTAGSGVATVGSWTLGTVAGGNTLTATSGSLAGSPATFTATGTAGAVSASLSTVTASAASITACASGCVVGTTASTITVTALDQFSNPINGASVNPVATTGLGNTFTPSFGSTNSSGVLTSVFNSTQATTKPITATVNGVLITQSPTVTVTPDAVSLTTSTLSVSAASMTACSSGCLVGSTAVTVTEVVRDQFSNVRPGSAAGLSATGTVNTFTPASGVTDGTGTFQSTFNATLIGLHTISATANFSTITQTQGVTVNAAAAASIAVNAGNNQTVRINTAVPTLPSVIVKDAFGNVTSGVTVTFAAATGGGSGTGLSTSTGGTGIATVGSWTVQAAVAASGTGTHSNTMTATATGFAGGGNPVTFTAQGIYTLSGDAQPIFTANCVGCHGGGGNQPNLTAGTTRSSTVGVAALCTSGTRIVAGSASTSVLFLRMQGASCGVMPPGGGISVANQNIVRDWINNGALNN